MYWCLFQAESIKLQNHREITSEHCFEQCVSQENIEIIFDLQKQYGRNQPIWKRGENSDIYNSKNTETEGGGGGGGGEAEDIISLPLRTLFHKTTK